MVDEHPVPGGGGVDGDGRDLPLLELKAQVAAGVLVQGQSPLKRPDRQKNKQNEKKYGEAAVLQASTTSQTSQTNLY